MPHNKNKYMFRNALLHIVCILSHSSTHSFTLANSSYNMITTFIYNIFVDKNPLNQFQMHIYAFNIFWGYDFYQKWFKNAISFITIKVINHDYDHKIYIRFS